MESGHGTPKSSPLRQKQQQQRLAAEMAAIDQSTGESFHMSTSASFNHAQHSDWLVMSPSSSGGPDFPSPNSSSAFYSGGGTRYQQPPRHLCLSPISGGSNSLTTSNTLSEGMQLFLPSPSSSSSSHHHSTSMTTLLQQQQQSETMSFTSAFNSSLRHRRGKTLILPKLKIPSGRSGSGSGLSAEAGDESSSSFAYQSHHHHRSTTSTHFRRSVSTSTFAESSTTTAASATAATAAASTLSSSWYASASSRQASEFSSSSVFSSNTL